MALGQRMVVFVFMLPRDTLRGRIAVTPERLKRLAHDTRVSSSWFPPKLVNIRSRNFTFTV